MGVQCQHHSSAEKLRAESHKIFLHPFLTETLIGLQEEGIIISSMQTRKLRLKDFLDSVGRRGGEEEEEEEPGPLLECVLGGRH